MPPTQAWLDKVKKFFGKNKFFKLSYLFLAGAGVCLLAGQIQIFSQELAAGLGLTLAAVLLLLAGLVGDERIFEALTAFSQAAANAWVWLDARIRKLVEARTRPNPEPEESRAATIVERPDTPAPASRVRKSRLITLTIPKRVLVIAGGLLVLVSQPLLLTEQFLPGLACLLPGLGLVLGGLSLRQPAWVVGPFEVAKPGLLLVGLGLMVLGTLLMYKNMQIRFLGEVLGFVLNVAGVFTLFFLFPRTLADPAPEPGDIFDLWTGAAPHGRALGIKAVLAIAGLGLLYFSNLAASRVGPSAGIILVLLALTALGLSFPWARARALSASPAPGVWILRFFRLAAFGAAFYLAYQGQSLIAKEQLYPGLYRYGLAVVLMLIAFREPAAQADRLKEKPLAWYWEALGLAVVLALGTFLRSYLMDVMPFGIECDEAGAGYHAADILNNQFNSLTVHPSGRPLFMLLGKVVAFKFFGIDNVGMHFTAMLYGVLGILALYLMARFLFGPRVALAAAALMAVSRWHIHFSRFGWSNTEMILFQILGMYFFAKGLAVRSKWHFMISGLAFALSLHTETSARMVVFLVAGLWVYVFLSGPRNFFRRYWQPLLVMALGVWLASANLAVFWKLHPQYLINRVAEVSVFSNDVNAPRNPVQGLADSAKYNLLQMNWHGDTRTRHNGGLSGEPVLDFWSAILFTLGLGLAVYYWRRLRYGMLIMWFGCFMCASIFSIEAPQSHRAFGVLPAIFLFSAAFLDRARRLLQESLGRPGAWAGAAAFLALMVPITSINYHKYFDAFPGFDTECTAAAKYMGRKWPKAEQAVMSAFLWMGHPPFILYSPKVKGHFFYSLDQVLPMRIVEPNDVNYTLILEYPPVLPAIQHFYPQGILTEETHPKFLLQYKGWAVPKENFLSTRGLQARYWRNAEWRGRPDRERREADLPAVLSSATWPWPEAVGSVEWQGSLYIPHHGRYTFMVSGDAEVDFRLGAKVSLQTSGGATRQQTVYLPGGLQPLRVRMRRGSGENRVSLQWSSPDTAAEFLLTGHAEPFGPEPLPASLLFTYPAAAGLLETFWSGPDWQGTRLRQTVQPSPFFFWSGSPWGFALPLSADWRGQLKVEKAGLYRFAVEQSGYAELAVDGRAVLVSGPPPAGWNPPQAGNQPVYLEAGTHPLILRWSTSSGGMFKLWWTPPGGEKSIISPQFLLPAQE